MTFDLSYGYQAKGPGVIVGVIVGNLFDYFLSFACNAKGKALALSLALLLALLPHFSYDNAKQVSRYWNLMVLLCSYNNAGNNARRVSVYWNLMVLLYRPTFYTITPAITPSRFRTLEFRGLIVFCVFLTITPIIFFYIKK